MLIQKSRKSMFAIKVLMIGTLAFGTWFQPSDAYGMGYYEKILDNEHSEVVGFPMRKCVRQGIANTGQGIVAISYENTFRCLMFQSVTGTKDMGHSWCSQWVVPNAVDWCLHPPGWEPLGGPGGGGDCPESEETATECSDNTGSPILLDLDRNRFQLAGGPVFFDIDADGRLEIVTWVASNSRDGFLYLDRNGNGVVDNGSELFGDSTLLMNGDRAENGYEALAEFDKQENGGSGDGVIDSSDSIFPELRIWVDSNANGAFEDHESLNLVEAGVFSLRLNYRLSPQLDQYGNEYRYISRGLIEKNGNKKRFWTTDIFFKVLAE